MMVGSLGQVSVDKKKEAGKALIQAGRGAAELFQAHDRGVQTGRRTFQKLEEQKGAQEAKQDSLPRREAAYTVVFISGSGSQLLWLLFILY